MALKIQGAIIIILLGSQASTKPNTAGNVLAIAKH